MISSATRYAVCSHYRSLSVHSSSSIESPESVALYLCVFEPNTTFCLCLFFFRPINLTRNWVHLLWNEFKTTKIGNSCDKKCSWKITIINNHFIYVRKQITHSTVKNKVFLICFQKTLNTFTQTTVTFEHLLRSWCEPHFRYVIRNSPQTVQWTNVTLKCFAQTFNRQVEAGVFYS